MNAFGDIESISKSQQGRNNTETIGENDGTNTEISHWRCYAAFFEPLLCTPSISNSARYGWMLSISLLIFGRMEFYHLHNQRNGRTKYSKRMECDGSGTGQVLRNAHQLDLAIPKIVISEFWVICSSWIFSSWGSEIVANFPLCGKMFRAARASHDLGWFIWIFPYGHSIPFRCRGSNIAFYLDDNHSEIQIFLAKILLTSICASHVFIGNHKCPRYS